MVFIVMKQIDALHGYTNAIFLVEKLYSRHASW
ncbi:hypothetical protein V172_10370 [Citrobacter freundii RLS1]|nr:hypothetical protein V172_10370 [Citrobacter freundii RLS1]